MNTTPSLWAVFLPDGTHVSAKSREQLAYFDTPPVPLYASAPAVEQAAGCVGKCNWSDESRANGWRSTCTRCGARAQGSGQ